MKSLLVSTAAALATALIPATPATAATALHVDVTRPVEATNVVTSTVVRLGTGTDRAEPGPRPLRTGTAIYRLTRISPPANTFAAEVASYVPAGTELAIDIRGRLRDGQWSEWTEITPQEPAVLPQPVRTAELRVMLWAPPGVPSPSLHALLLLPSHTPAAAATAAVPPAGLSYRIFATREGLVGGRTANGHVIKDRDHFAALPSRRALSRDLHGDYTVRICTPTRCEWAPVYDVGPWNTRDDYWNPPSQRQEWTDLPQGRPQAQAAYESRYNQGKDQYGRKVTNPAGIDLGDGTFWDGLGLTTNSWVTVTYQWTGTLPAGYVSSNGVPLNVRTGPSTRNPVSGVAADYAQVRIECKVTGQSVVGTRGTSAVWFRLAPGKFVSAAYVSGGATVKAC